jgi:hypothetical protein
MKMKTELQLEVTTNKDAYLKGEDIFVRVYLFNFSSRSIIVNSRFAIDGVGSVGELSFQVIGPSSRPLLFATRVNVGILLADHFSLVGPWHCVGKQFKLRSYYKVNKPGQYKLSATYSNKGPDEQLNVNAWVGNLQSETITFWIEEKEHVTT